MESSSQASSIDIGLFKGYDTMFRLKTKSIRQSSNKLAGDYFSINRTFLFIFVF